MAKPIDDGPFAFFAGPTFTKAMAHLFFASTWMLTASHWLNLWWCIDIIVVAAAVKEFLIDPAAWFENDPIWPNGLQDFAGYMVGMVLGLVLVWIQK